jgi:hypothetical protein
MERRSCLPFGTRGEETDRLIVEHECVRLISLHLFAQLRDHALPALHAVPI